MIEGEKEARTKRKQSMKLGEFLCYKLLFFLAMCTATGTLTE